MTKNPIISFLYPHDVCLIILLTVLGSIKEFGQKRSLMWQKNIVRFLRGVAEKVASGFASAKSYF